MATLEKIRKRAGILVMGAIGLAMLGFILGDFNIRPSTKVAEINGTSYGYEEYQQEQQKLLNFYRMNYGQNLAPELEQQIENETWQRLVRTSVLGKSYKNLGLEVSLDELKSMVAGDQTSGLGNAGGAFSEPHYIVRQMFSNPETGEFNRYVMMNYFNSLDQEEYQQEKERWLFIENEITEERLIQKYFTLVGKGLAPSSLDVEDYYLENQKKVDFSFISKNFATVADEDISISEADLKAYYKENLESFRRPATRTIEYVSFDVVASETDDANSELWSKQTKNEFLRMEHDRLVSYINSISDEPFDSRYYAMNEISPLLTDSLLSLPEGSVFGPYYENTSYKLSRIMNRQSRPDSVRARHILIGYAVVGDIQRAEFIADSLKTVIENGEDFNTIASLYSTDDASRPIGGDLGWIREGDMETEFNNACFENKSGDLLLVKTRLGAHIIKIESQSRPVEKVQIATIVHNVIPSNETDQEFYNRAVKFRGKATNLAKFEEQAIEYGLDPRVVPGIAKDQRQIPGLSTPTQIIGWTYNADEGDVSTIYQVDESYIVVALTEVQDEGYADFESVRSEIELAVSKKKKGELIKAELAKSIDGASDLQSIAGANDLKVSEASQVQFANTFVTGIGLEPYIVGASMYLPIDKVSGPFIGENSVFLLSVSNKDEGNVEGDISPIDSRLSIGIQARCSYQAYTYNQNKAYEAMLEAASIDDRRLELFYGN